MAKKVILGTDIARDAFKTKANDNFTELYNKDASLEGQINTLDADVIAHKAENVYQILGMNSRDLSLAGVQVISGLPFVPDFVIVNASVNGQNKFSVGQADKIRQYAMGTVSSTNVYLRAEGIIIRIGDTNADITSATATINSDKTISLNWSKLGSGATGTVSFAITLFRHGGA